MGGLLLGLDQARERAHFDASFADRKWAKIFFRHGFGLLLFLLFNSGQKCQLCHLEAAMGKGRRRLAAVTI